MAAVLCPWFGVVPVPGEKERVRDSMGKNNVKMPSTGQQNAKFCNRLRH